MKRLWLEDRWHWSPSATTTRMGVMWRGAGVPPTRVCCCLYLVIIILIHVVPSSCGVGETCDMHELSPCSINEVCVQVNKTAATCQCLPHFEVNKATGQCEEPKPPPPPEPPGIRLGLALGLGLTLLLVLVILVLILLHRKFGLFSGMCDHFPSLRHLAIRSGDIILVDNEDEADVNPIV